MTSVVELLSRYFSDRMDIASPSPHIKLACDRDANGLLEFLKNHDFEIGPKSKDGSHVQPAEPSPDRAALVERVAEAISQLYTPVMPSDEWMPEAEAALAAVEAAGGWPAQRRFPDPHKRIVFGDS